MMDELVVSYQRIPKTFLYNAKIKVYPEDQLVLGMYNVDLQAVIRVFYGEMVSRKGCKIAFRPRPITDDLEGRDSAFLLSPNDESYFRESVENAEEIFAPNRHNK
jgi:hypothetical protein